MAASPCNRLLLPDSGHLLEEEANYASRKGYPNTRSRDPLTEEDAHRSLKQAQGE